MKRPHFTDDDSEFSRAGHYRGIVDIDYDGKNRPYLKLMPSFALISLDGYLKEFTVWIFPS